ncbi:RNA polymerase sigma factor [Dyadobacter sp. SG02]|uniref:RNA polymerase sigma factor n=1 Tax=Dyadobacter sp. SG02 TaxID=1855291 RepID=UPI0015A5BF6B|nr:sigma-70 family RNA polymerase sigma factor [Dyadobacter sp. SG02]
MHSPTDDRELWTAFKNGDREAFSRIYETHASSLLRYGSKISGNRQLVKDSIHDLFLHIWLRRGRLSDTDSIRFYLFRSLRNRMLENRAIAPEIPDADIETLMDGVFAELPAEELIVDQEKEAFQILRLKSAIARLPQRQQEALQLRYFHNFSTEEIASILAINGQSVRNLLHRSISQLRSLIEMAEWLLLLLFSSLV